MDVPLDEFLLELRKVKLEAKISECWYGFCIEIVSEKKVLGWVRISLNNKGHANVTQVTVMDDINASRDLEVTATRYRIPIRRTNKAEREAIANLPY